MVEIEGDENSVVITIMEPKGDGYTGTSAEISKTALILKLVEEGVLKENEVITLGE